METIQFTNKAYLLTGGNMGDRMGNLMAAKKNIEIFCGNIVKDSSIYETEAWGKTDQRNFLNQVLLIETKLTPASLMKEILLIEGRMGRQRKEKYGERTIDIDILFFNNNIINEEDLIIPHPEIQNRRFVLEPMNEIAPEFIHPVFSKKISALLKECGDNLGVKKI